MVQRYCFPTFDILLFLEHFSLLFHQSSSRNTISTDKTAKKVHICRKLSWLSGLRMELSLRRSPCLVRFRQTKYLFEFKHIMTPSGLGKHDLGSNWTFHNNKHVLERITLPWVAKLSHYKIWLVSLNDCPHATLTTMFKATPTRQYKIVVDQPEHSSPRPIENAERPGCYTETVATGVEGWH